MKRGRAKKTADRVAGGGVDWSPEVRAAVLVRSGGCCEVQAEGCVGERPGAELEVHHRKLRRHGDHRIENAIHVCVWNCHPWIHRVAYDPADDGSPVTAYEPYGWLVRSCDDPALIPWLRRGEWVGPDLPSRAPD